MQIRIDCGKIVLPTGKGSEQHSKMMPNMRINLTRHVHKHQQAICAIFGIFRISPKAMCRESN